MQITDIKSVSKTKFKVYLDGQFAFTLYKGELFRYRIQEDGELSEEVYQEIREKGYLGEFSIAGGTNYKDKLYLGAVLGIQWTYDKQRILYSEIAEENTPSLLVFYEFRQYRRTRVRGSI